MTIGAAVLFTIVTLMPADPASRRRVLVGALLVVVIASPWFVAVFQLEPDEASRRLLGYKHALNLGETPGTQSASPLFVLRIVAVGAFPWVAAAVVGLGAIRRDDAARIAAGTLLGGFLFFGLAEAKMGHFYGVLQPPLAVLAAIGLVAALRPASRARWYVPLALVATWSLIRVDPDTLLETATVFRQLGEWAQPALLASAVALAWSLLWVGAIWTGRPAATVATVVPAALLAGALALSAVPALGPRKSLGPAWERYAAERGPAEPLGVWGFAKDSIFYYSDNDVVRLKQPAALEMFLAPEGVRYLIAPRDELEGVMSLGEPGSRWERLELEHPTHELLRYRHDSGSRPSESPTRASVATGALGIDRTTLYRSMKRLGLE